MDYYIFNGDADGIIATRIFSGINGGKNKFITGVKRDISLLKQVEHLQNQTISVFDIAIEKNLMALEKLLKNNCIIKWFDHHISKDIPNNRNFKPVLNTDPKVNTTWLVSNYQKKFTPWTVAGLFGDNMTKTALNIGQIIDLNNEQIELLKDFGELLNYNSYGEKLADLFFPPVEILKRTYDFTDIFDLIDQTDIYEILSEGRDKDLKKARNAEIIAPGVIRFPNEAWAKRVIGIYANGISNREPEMAHAVLVENKEMDFVVSVRSAINQEKNVAEFCSLFPTGGGRMKAGGINKLPKRKLESFLAAFHLYFNQ